MFVAVISTPGISAPVESLTVPVSSPVVAVCAASRGDHPTFKQAMTNKHPKKLFPPMHSSSNHAAVVSRVFIPNL